MKMTWTVMSVVTFLAGSSILNAEEPSTETFCSELQKLTLAKRLEIQKSLIEPKNEEDMARDDGKESKIGLALMRFERAQAALCNVLIDKELGLNQKP